MWPGDRVREKASPIYQSLRQSYGFYNYWGYLVWYDQTPSSVIVAQERSMMVDMEPVPGSVKRGEKPCFHVTNKIEGSSAAITRWYGGYWVKEPAVLYTGIPTDFLAIPGGTTSHVPDVLGDFLLGVDPLKDVVQGLPFIKEMKQTRDMVKSPFKFLSQDWPRLARGGREAIKKASRRKASLAEALTRTGFDKGSNLWLEAHYGWDPLFMDIANVATSASSFSSEYDRYKNGDPSWTKFRSTQSISSETSNDVTALDWLETTNSELLRVTGSYRVKPAGSTGYALSYPNFLAKKMGLNLTSVASAAWEVIPYSFVLDWLIPVGDLLTKLTNTQCEFDLQNVSHHHILRGEQTRYFKLGAPINHPYGGAEKTQGWIKAWKSSSQQYSRNYGIPKPTGIAFGGLTTTKVMSGLSLIAQRLHLPLK